MRHLALVLLLIGSATARAEVVDSAADGFTVKQTVTVAAPRARAWAALVDIASWWAKDHTYTGDTKNLSLDPRPGGCFCEKLPDGGVTHLTIVYVDREKLLRLTGGLGPLQELAVAGAMTVKLIEAKGKTTVELTYRVGGYAPGGALGTLAKPVDGMLGAQLTRYQHLVDTGKP